VFHSFFAKPKLFFASFAVWALACVIFWFSLGQDLGVHLSLGQFFGVTFPPPLAEGADEAAQASFAAAHNSAMDIWFYQYTFLSYAIFVASWFFGAPHPWRRWSVVGSALILIATWYLVEVDVMINEWFGRFYDLIQRALAEPGTITYADFYGEIWTFGYIAVIAITIAVVLNFFVSHYVFRWRTALNDRYTALWPKVRHIEGASQRVQDDTMRFARIVEDLGTSFLDSIMTLIAFLPILWGLSKHVTELPILGPVPHSLVFVAVLWSIFGTVALAAVGVKLPGIYFINQRNEAAYRKELVLGEDHADRAQPPTLRELYDNVRKNYFHLYLNYLYFNVARYAYLQTSVLVAYIALGPTIIAGSVTFGIIQQTVRAFGRVQASFQFLVNSWTTIVELMSIYKRLAAFEAAIANQPLPEIDQEYLIVAARVE
jgi:peptide/bleomycin uptake transporter